jgi:hypothetical protein
MAGSVVGAAACGAVAAGVGAADLGGDAVAQAASSTNAPTKDKRIESNLIAHAELREPAELGKSFSAFDFIALRVDLAVYSRVLPGYSLEAPA